MMTDMEKTWKSRHGRWEFCIGFGSIAVMIVYDTTYDWSAVGQIKFISLLLLLNRTVRERTFLAHYLNLVSLSGSLFMKCNFPLNSQLVQNGNNQIIIFSRLQNDRRPKASTDTLMQMREKKRVRDDSLGRF